MNSTDVGRDLRGSWPRSRVLNAWVDSLTIGEIIERLDSGTLFTLNAVHLYFLQRNAEFAAAYRSASLTSSDSKYVYWGLKLLGRSVKEKASGSDIFPAYWRHYANNPDVSIFLLRARPGVADTAAARINRFAGRDIVVGTLSPSFQFFDDDQEIDAAIDTINATRATCLVVGLNAPEQEIWIARHRSKLTKVKVVMGLGATIDYEAEAVRRAPPWMSRNGLEWVYRVVTEPRRYWQRYARAAGCFWLVLLGRFDRYRPPAFPSPAVEPGVSHPAQEQS